MTLELLPQAVAQDAGYFTFPGVYTPYIEALDDLTISASGSITLDPAQYVISNAYVGIGVTPTSILDMMVDGGGAYVKATSYRDSQYGGGFQFRHARGSESIPAISANSDITMLIVGYGYASGFKPNADIKFNIAGTPSSTSMPGQIDFYTTPVGAITSELALRITSGKSLSAYGNLAFQQASTISTTAGDLTLAPNGGDVIITGHLAVNKSSAPVGAFEVEGTVGSFYVDAGGNNVYLTRAATNAIHAPNGWLVLSAGGNSVLQLNSNYAMFLQNIRLEGKYITNNSATLGIAISDAGDITFGGSLTFSVAETISTTAGDLTLDSAGYTIIRDNTIIGPTITTPDGTLHVHTNSAGAVTAYTPYNDLIIENSGDAGISILAPDTATVSSGIAFGYGTDNQEHMLFAYGPSHSTYPGEMGLYIANGTRLRMTASEFRFYQAQTISTTSGSLTLDPAGSSVLIQGATASIAGLYFDTDRKTATQTISAIHFRGHDSVSTTQEYARIDGAIVSPTTTDEYGGIDFYVVTGGALAQAFKIRSSSAGVGASIPATLDGTFHVHTATAGVVAGYTAGLTIENNAECGINILVPDASTGRFRMGTPTSTNNYHGLDFFSSTHASKAGVLGLHIAGSRRVEFTTTEMAFLQAQTISTTSGDLTLDPAGDLVLPLGKLFGVGITTPLAPIHIRSAAGGSTSLRIQTDGGYINFAESNGGNFNFTNELGYNILYGRSDGRVAIGANTVATAQLYVDNWRTTGEYNVLYLYQHDTSAPVIKCTIGSDNDVILLEVVVTGTPQFNWLETPDQFALTKGLQLSGNLAFQQASIISTTTGTISMTPQMELFLDPGADIRVNKVMNYDWGMGNSSKDPTTDAPDDWIEHEISGAVYYVPAYLA